MLYRCAVFIVITFSTAPNIYADGCHVAGVKNYSYPTYQYHNTNHYVPTYYPTQAYAIPIVVFPTTAFVAAPDIVEAKIRKTLLEEAEERAEARFEKRYQDLLRKVQPVERQPVEQLTRDPETIDPLAGVNVSLGNNIPPALLAGNRNLSAQVAAVLNESCVKCHASKDTIDLSDIRKIEKDVKLRERIADCVSRHEGATPMPPKGDLPSAKKKLLQKWGYTSDS